MTTKFSKSAIEKELEGYWYRSPKKEDWFVETVVISRGQVRMEGNKKKLFIAIDSETWHEGSRNRDMYAGWIDTHTTVKSFEGLIDGVIAQRPIAELDENIPQYIVENTYNVIKILAEHSFEKFTGKTIAITGTAGKSTSKNIRKFLMEKHHAVIATRGNHNTRTGVPLTVVNAITDPDYLIIESAISGLWSEPHGIMKHYPPDVALITSIDGGQQKSAYETAILKAKVAEGMNHQGVVVINSEAKEYDVLYQEVQKYNTNIKTYGFTSNSDSYVLKYEELKGKVSLEANILGEKIIVETLLLGKAMVQNILGVLTTLKLLNIPLTKVIPVLENYKPEKGIQSFEEIKTVNNGTFTLLDDSWNATGIAMIEAIELFEKQAKYYKGKKIAILGRIENLTDDEARKQHEALAEPLIKAKFDIIFAHGPEMKYLLEMLPETLIGGYFENSQKLVNAVTPLIDKDSFVLFKGSPRSSDFSEVKADLLAKVRSKKQSFIYTNKHPDASGAGALTFDIETNEVVGQSGKIDVKQNQGLGNMLLIDLILNKLFKNELNLSEMYVPGQQAINENKAPNAIVLEKGEQLSLYTILQIAIVQNAPNALLMLANQVIGNNKEALKKVRALGTKLAIDKAAMMNLTGRKIASKEQILTLPLLYQAAKSLFDKYPQELTLLSQSTGFHKGVVYRSKTNLYKQGVISHGLFYGYLDSIGVVYSRKGAKKYITVVLGATDAFERDCLITNALENAVSSNKKALPSKDNKIVEKDKYTINLIGDTYFGEFYTKIRKRQRKKDALQEYGRSYSFDGIRSLIETGDINICNFEAAISENTVQLLKHRKPYVLFADLNETVPVIKQEQFDLVTLGNNHLMDCGLEGLQETLVKFKEADIMTIGAGLNQAQAEKPFVKIINGKRTTIFNAYWYRTQMYLEYDFYAIGENPGVSCLSGKIFEQIKAEKKIILMV